MSFVFWICCLQQRVAPNRAALLSPKHVPFTGLGFSLVQVKVSIPGEKSSNFPAVPKHFAECAGYHFAQDRDINEIMTC